MSNFHKLKNSELWRKKQEFSHQSGRIKEERNSGGNLPEGLKLIKKTVINTHHMQATLWDIKISYITDFLGKISLACQQFSSSWIIIYPFSSGDSLEWIGNFKINFKKKIFLRKIKLDFIKKTQKLFLLLSGFIQKEFVISCSYLPSIR